MDPTRRPPLAILFTLSILTVYGCSNDTDDPGTTTGNVTATGGATDTAADGASPVDSGDGDAEQIVDGDSAGTDDGGGVDGATDTMPTDGETDPPSDADESPTDADGTQTGEDVADAAPETDPVPTPDPPDAAPIPDVDQDALVTPTLDGSGDTGSSDAVCCLPNDSCSFTSRSVCENQGGEVAIGRNSCGDVQCSQFTPKYACCNNGTCSRKTESNCKADGGTPRTARTCQNTTCSGQQLRPCCINPVNQPFCRMVTRNDCSQLGGSSRREPDCTAITCGGESLSACCNDGDCVATTSSLCSSEGGTFNKDQTCDQVNCQ